MLDKNLEKKWLIKSDNKILGPYHFEQIEDLLKRKQISLIDEVRDTDTRWLYIRENPQFKNIVEAIRKEIDSKSESTKTYQTGSRTNTELNNKTNAELPRYTEVDVREASIVQESEMIVPALPALKEKAKIYGLPQDQYFQKKVQSSNRSYLIYGIFFILVIGLLAASAAFYQKRSAQKQEEELFTQIKKFQFLGYDQKAVDLYAKLSEPQQKKILPEVLTLFPLLETNHFVQLKDVEDLQRNPDLTVEQKTNIQLIRFWSAMQSQNIPAATEALVKARSIQPSADIVLEIKAILDFRKNDFQSSFETYMSLYKKESFGRYLVGAMQAWSALAPIQKMAVMPSLSQLIERHTSSYYDYKKELLLGQLALSRLQKNEVLFKVSWPQFLNTPAQMSSLFKKPLLLAPQVYQWKDLEEFKITVRAALPPEDLIAFEIHNYLENSQVSAAQQYADNNLTKIKDRAVKQQMTLLTLYSQSRKNEILALEKTGQLDMKSELNHLLFALTRLEANPQADIAVYLDFFQQQQLVFDKDWLTLVQLMKRNQLDQLKIFVREHFITINNFIPLIEAKSMTE